MDSSNIVDWSSSMNSSNILNSSNMMNRGGRLNSSNMVNRGNIVNSSNIVYRSHRLHSSNAVNRVDRLNHWSSISSISSISNAIVSSIIRISLPLGHMDSAGRVSNIATSSSIGSGSHYSRHSSRGCSSDRRGGRGRNLSVSSMVVSMVNRGCIAINSSIVSNSTISNRGSSMDNRSTTIATIPSIPNTLEPRVSKTISSISSISNAIVSSIIRISLPLGHMDSSSRVSNI